MIRWIGILFIVFGATATGLTMAANVKHTVKTMQKFISILCEMRAEIEFHLTPLGELCGKISEKAEAPLKNVFKNVQQRLYAVPGRPVGIQMREAIFHCGQTVPRDLKDILTDLFDALGKQDVYAQLRAIDLAHKRTENALNTLENDKNERCKTYRIISICAGIAAAVILI